MKLVPDMYHLNSFHLHRNEGGSEWAGDEHIPKTIKKWHEINKILTLTSSYTSFQNAMNIVIFLMSSLTIWL